MQMELKRAFRFFPGILVLALYELLLDGSGAAMKARWSKLKSWAEKIAETQTAAHAA